MRVSWNRSKHVFHLFDSLNALLAVAEEVAEERELVGVGAIEPQQRTKAYDTRLAHALLLHLGLHVLQADFVDLVDGHGDVGQALRLAHGLGDACQNLAVVELDEGIDSELGVDVVEQ